MYVTVFLLLSIVIVIFIVTYYFYLTFVYHKTEMVGKWTNVKTWHRLSASFYLSHGSQFPFCNSMLDLQWRARGCLQQLKLFRGSDAAMPTSIYRRANVLLGHGKCLSRCDRMWINDDASKWLCLRYFLLAEGCAAVWTNRSHFRVSLENAKICARK